jgi:uncharacterized protein YxjI
MNSSLPAPHEPTRLAFPVEMRFKIFALAHQIGVRDAHGRLLLWFKQKMFKLRDAITVYADEEQTIPLYRVQADRIIDFNAQFEMTDMAGNALGRVARQGVRSLWRARYDVLVHGAVAYTIFEENPFIKVLDGLMGEIPVVGIFTGYFLNPRYRLERGGGGPMLLRITKKRSFLESGFHLEATSQMQVQDEAVTVLAVLVMVLHERRRG